MIFYVHKEAIISFKERLSKSYIYVSIDAINHGLVDRYGISVQQMKTDEMTLIPYPFL